MKHHVEIGHLTKHDTSGVNRDEVFIFIFFISIYLLYKNNIIYSTHITIINLQYIIKILEILTLFPFIYLFIYDF